MRSFTVVVIDPLDQNLPEMALVERNHPIEAVPPGGPNEAFAVCVGLRSPYGRLEPLQRHRLKGVVDRRREDAVAVVYDGPIRGIEGQAVSKLLDRPLGSGVLGDIPVHHRACRDVEQDEDIEPSKCDRDHQKKVAREDGARMVLEEGGPRLERLATPRSRASRHVSTNRSGRKRETEFQAELSGDSLLAPRSICYRHFDDKALEFDWDPRSTSRTRPRSPEEAIEVAMPSNERVRTDNRQQVVPGDESRQEDERDPRGVAHAPRSGLAFDVAGELLPQE
jgi:hypothetical protein